MTGMAPIVANAGRQIYASAVFKNGWQKRIEGGLRNEGVRYTEERRGCVC